MYRILCVSDVFFFFQAEDGIRDLVRSRGLGDVYKRQQKQTKNLKVLIKDYLFLQIMIRPGILMWDYHKNWVHHFQ